MIEFCLVPAFLLWHVLHEGISPFSVSKYPPPSGRHAMRCFYVIGRDSWVRDMSNTQWLEMESSHEVGECSVTAVCPRAGVYSRRRLRENYCCCCCCCCCSCCCQVPDFPHVLMGLEDTCRCSYWHWYLKCALSACIAGIRGHLLLQFVVARCGASRLL